MSGKAKLIIVAGNLASGGIATYVQKIVKLYPSEIHLISSDFSDDFKTKVKVTTEKISLGSFGLKIWPLKELEFAWKARKILDRYSHKIIILNYSVFPSRFFNKNEVINVFHSLHRQFILKESFRTPLLLALSFLHFCLMPFDLIRQKKSQLTLFVSKKAFKRFGLNNSIYLPNAPLMSDAPPTFKLKKIGNSEFARKKPRILLVGRLDPYKGLDLFAALANRYRDRYEFAVAGSGWRGIETQFPNLNFLGQLSPIQFKEAYLNSILQVSTSYVENMPSIIFDALFNCTPLLASDVGDCSLLLKPAYLFKSGSIDDLCEKFGSLLVKIEKEPAQVEADFSETLNRIKLEFNMENVMSSLMSIFRGTP